MSCFIVSNKHISALVDYALARQRREQVFSGRPYDPATGQDWSEQDLGALLQRENVASWNARYPRDPAEPAFQFRRVIPELSPIEIVKAVRCYEYQSCEHEGWKTSDARKIVGLIFQHAITEIEGYEDAPWGLE